MKENQKAQEIFRNLGNIANNFTESLSQLNREFSNKDIADIYNTYESHREGILGVIDD